MPKRQRRSFSSEQKADAVRMVRELGSVPEVARRLDLTETALRAWVKQADVDEGNGPEGALTSEERKELQQLRRRVRTLEMERDFAKKAAGCSTCQRNTRFQGILRALIHECLPWPLVQPACHLVESALAVLIQRRPFREVLAQ